MSNQNQKADPAQLGLRERKKQQTRLAVSEVATRLFIARGFDAVTIAEVASAANVSTNTVFNYFATKEELFFDRGPEFEAAPSRVVLERHRGESAIAALRRSFRKLINDPAGLLYRQRLRPFLATVEASPALEAHARLLLADSQRSLCETLVSETGSAADDETARTLAALISALYAVLIEEFRRGVLAGDSVESQRRALSRLGERGFELLMAAAGDYCVRSSES